jgi:3-oxoacyl-[acyl-carrier protein] reductase
MTSSIDRASKEKYAKRRVPLSRYGEPQEVAHATLNLCLPSSSFINGAILPVDGGLSIKRA